MADLKNRVREYYAGKFASHGPTPKGVDWKDELSQNLRFEVLHRVIQEQSFSVLDYGCGYGALLSYLEKKFPELSYTGFDLVQESLQVAEKQYPNANWIGALPNNKTWDYVIGSGIFNTMANSAPTEWNQYIEATLREIWNLSDKGFSCNFLTAYSDKEKQRTDLYYSQPEEILKFCLQNFGRHVTLVHDYPLYEFTVMVRKDK